MEPHIVFEDEQIIAAFKPKGLPNVQSVSDKFSITSSAKGTVVISTIFLKPQP